MLANAMRGLAAEFGLTVPLGMGKLTELKQLVDADETVPEAARQAVRGLLDQGRWLAESIDTFEAEIVTHARRDDIARRLATIPGIGPITSSLIAATVADIGVFQSARHFAAWLGLVPRQHSTGGKTRLGRITKAGNREIRRLLVFGGHIDGLPCCRMEQFRRGLDQRGAGAPPGPAGDGGAGEQDGAHRLGGAGQDSGSVAAGLPAEGVMTRKEVYCAKGRVAAAVEALA